MDMTKKVVRCLLRFSDRFTGGHPSQRHHDGRADGVEHITNFSGTRLNIDYYLEGMGGSARWLRLFHDGQHR
jgi:hypothetical protein